MNRIASIRWVGAAVVACALSVGAGGTIAASEPDGFSEPSPDLSLVTEGPLGGLVDEPDIDATEVDLVVPPAEPSPPPWPDWFRSVPRGGAPGSPIDAE
jgi:hypothetical protein